MTARLNMKMQEHPRLIFSARDWDGLSKTGGVAVVETAAKRVLKMADDFLGATVFEYPENTHNAHLVRARIMQCRILTLLVAWRMTGAERYRNSAIAHVLQIGRWKYWSWLAWRSKDAGPDAIFDLSYGENSATLALAWDILFDSLSDGEREEMIAIARRFSFAAFFKNGRAAPSWWWLKRADSNWLSVCAGGLGMLAMAMFEEIPESRRALGYIEKGMKDFMEVLGKTDGGWTEGIGYWGYGMRYAFWYLLSAERAFGREHPLMRLKGTARTLDFPLDFTPNGVPCSFGDSASFGLQPIHYSLAKRFKRPDILARVDALAERAQALAPAPRGWPADAELLLSHPRVTPGKSRAQHNMLRHYKGMDWFFMADQWPEPRFYVSMRGGTTAVPHGQLDLMSFHAVVGNEALITSLNASEYLDTTFSPRRYELPEMTPLYKNSILVNGVGVSNPSTVKSSALTLGKCRAVRMDATTAMGASRAEKPFHFCGRVFIWLEGCGLAILDVADLVHVGRFESRFHTMADLTARKDGALLKEKKGALQVAFAASVPCEVRQAAPAMTSPSKRDPRTLRWCTIGQHYKMALATLLTPGRTPGRISLEESRNRLILQAEIGRKTWRFKLSWKLTA